MLLNSYIAWNLATCERKYKKSSLRKCNFYAALAEEMTIFGDVDVLNTQSKEFMSPYMYYKVVVNRSECQTNLVEQNHSPQVLNVDSTKRRVGIIFKMELNIDTRENKKIYTVHRSKTLVLLYYL